MISDVPDNLEEAMPVSELGGAIGRRASVACLQGQHDLCTGRQSTGERCDCRCHEDKAAELRKYLDKHNGIPSGFPDPWED